MTIKSDSADGNAWLVLIHHFPREPGALRVKIWRRLQSMGAVAIKSSVYVLPKNEQAQEDFEWLLQEIIAGDAEGVLLESRFIDGMSDQQVQGLFDTAREEDYAALAVEVRACQESLSQDFPKDEEQLRGARNVLARFRKRLEEIEAIDFFGADGREVVGSLVATLADRINAEPTAMRSETKQELKLNDLQGRTWVTRSNVYVDRIASAWLIRRWIDPRATFKFTAKKRYSPSRREVRFDMFEAEFTHEGDKCTFEVLLSKAGIDDVGLRRIAEIVHDIDLKDRKYNHDQTPGITNLLAGIVANFTDDDQRIERGSAMLDDLYRSFRKKVK